MLDILKALDVNMSADDRLELLGNHIEKFKETLVELQNITKEWPRLPSDSPQDKVDINFKQYYQAYDSLKVLLSPSDDGFKELTQLKNNVNSARDELKFALKNKSMVGIQSCLDKAKRLQDLLQQQRVKECQYIEILIHRWRTAALTFAGDLNTK
ncbi:hypothetical protein TVAG_147800 [Trichomonas vaginalis G3]|uniref:Uncharacterized protein n=1 Tax=Trichomonas vaginalis (strain ATCC PRA-98 / G3) TaxID=412133 RepID=A2FVD0_TRIV3|nr:hypothetical protein TVAGG3_0403520 [Trichomonas vaginalis G3]EAX91133.1 hypothetical protein TVAG_147800 [Trichomonas vaginalis G3]KAI5534868.1 hypothetical protein TVAGG3_0403520 [Trichomonas vaginalis G3]|eukprot:XP_001304063.1 hypothetical protein [Trichomonas vaginalis G3]